MSTSFSLQAPAITLLAAFFVVSNFGHRKKLYAKRYFLVCTRHFKLPKSESAIIIRQWNARFVSFTRSSGIEYSAFFCLVFLAWKSRSNGLFCVWKLWVITVITCLSESQSHVSALNECNNQSNNTLERFSFPFCAMGFFFLSPFLCAQILRQFMTLLLFQFYGVRFQFEAWNQSMNFH